MQLRKKRLGAVWAADVHRKGEGIAATPGYARVCSVSFLGLELRISHGEKMETEWRPGKAWEDGNLQEERGGF